MDAKQSNGEISSDGECGNVPLPRFTAELKAKWIAALRSGGYEQCTGRLRKEGGFCCLGVLSEVSGFESVDSEMLQTSRQSFSESAAILNSATQLRLSQMNDDGMSFGMLADHIETRIPAEE